MNKMIEGLSRRVSRLAARKLGCRWLPLGRGPGVVSFSFDDVAASACHSGAAILEQHDARATFFICGGLTGQLEQGQRCHQVADLQQLQARGHEIACHTYSHLNCADTPIGQLQSDWQRNQQFFQQHGLRLDGFAFPFGAYGWASKRAAGQRFSYARITGGGLHSGRADLGALRAQALYAASITDDQIGALIAQTRQSGGWLIFYSHEVIAEPGQWGTSPDQLSHCVATARAAGCEILTVRDAIGYFSQT